MCSRKRPDIKESHTQTNFQPVLWVTLTFAPKCRPRNQSHAIKLVKRYLQKITDVTGLHIMSLAGVGSNNHFHIIICSSNHFDIHGCDEVDIQTIGALWGKGKVEVSLFDTTKSGVESYTLEKHAVVEDLFQRVFCPHIRHECRGKNGYVLIRDRSRYRITGN